VPSGLQNLPAASTISQPSATVQYYAPYKSEPHPNAPDHNNSSPENPPRGILGMTRTVFLLKLALILVIIAGVVGGAVGGTIGKKSSTKSDSLAECGSNSQ
jgi:hypothetical protein